MRLSAPALALATALLLPLGASGLTIDDFEDGDFSLTDTTAFSIESQTQSALSGVAAGIRESFVTLGGAGTSASISVGGGAGTASVGAGATATFVAFHYDGLANGAQDFNGQPLSLDLTVDGDRFLIDVAAVVGSVTIAVSVSDGTLNQYNFGSGIIVSSPGVFEVPFTSGTLSGVDFTDVDGIQLRVFDLGTNGSSISFGSLSTGFAVPEPTTAALLACGLVGLARRTRRASAAG